MAVLCGLLLHFCLPYATAVCVRACVRENVCDDDESSSSSSPSLRVLLLLLLPHSNPRKRKRDRMALAVAPDNKIESSETNGFLLFAAAAAAVVGQVATE